MKRRIPESITNLSDELLEMIMTSGCPEDREEAEAEVTRRKTMTMAPTHARVKLGYVEIEALIKLEDIRGDNLNEIRDIVLKELEELGGISRTIDLHPSHPLIEHLGVNLMYSQKQTLFPIGDGLSDGGSVREVSIE